MLPKTFPAPVVAAMRESWPNFCELVYCDRFTTDMKRLGT
jgi:hypothetical protein